MPPTTDTRAMALAPRGFGQTTRRDAWWATPLATFLGPLRVRRLRDVGGVPERALHLRPVPLAVLLAASSSATRRTPGSAPKPGWWPAWLPFSPALLILPFPGLFRFTCYYYRGAYYKAFWADPPSCAVGEPRKSYRGEHSFPLILQNVHRYFLYVALVFLVVLSYDVWKALWFTDPATGAHVVRHRRRHARARRQRRAARRLHARLPLAAPPRRRAARRGVEASRRSETAYACVELPQPPAHAVRLVQPVLGRRSRTSTSASARWASGPT